MDCPRHLAAGLAFLRHSCLQPWPLLPNEQARSAAHSASEQLTSSERGQLLHGIMDHISPPTEHSPRSIALVQAASTAYFPIQRALELEFYLVAITGAFRILAVRLQRAPNTSVSGSSRCLIPPPVGRKHSKSPTPILGENVPRHRASAGSCATELRASCGRAPPPAVHTNHQS